MPPTTQQRLCFVALAIVMSAATYAAAQAGTLDPTFGTNGIVATTIQTATALALQSDGKIVIGGLGRTNDGDFDALLRLNTDGSLDTSFGSGGVASFAPGILGVFAIAIQSDGKIIAAVGNDSDSGGGQYIFFTQLARVQSNGTLDTSFGTAGFTATKSIGFTPDSESVESVALALQSNGSILVGSSYSNVMARFTSSGQLDTTFGTAGLVNLANAGSNLSEAPAQIAVEKGGKILVAIGSVAPTPFAQAGTISRYNTNGSLDTTFGTFGTATSAASASALSQQSDGKIVIAGSLTSKLNAPPASNNVGFGAARFTSGGVLDRTFGSGGVAVADFGTTAPLSGAFTVAIQSNGDVVAGGAAAQGQLTLNFNSAFGLARFTSAGVLDISFGNGGLVTTTLETGSGVYSYVTGLAIQSDGKIVAAGSTIVGQGFDAGTNGYVARYQAQ